MSRIIYHFESFKCRFLENQMLLKTLYKILFSSCLLYNNFYFIKYGQNPLEVSSCVKSSPFFSPLVLPIKAPQQKMRSLLFFCASELSKLNVSPKIVARLRPKLTFRKSRQRHQKPPKMPKTKQNKRKTSKFSKSVNCLIIFKEKRQIVIFID